MRSSPVGGQPATAEPGTVAVSRFARHVVGGRIVFTVGLAVSLGCIVLLIVLWIGG